MRLEARRVYNPRLIKDIITCPTMWRTVAEDGQDPESYQPDLEKGCWLLIQGNRGTVALYNFRAENSVTVEAHTHTVLSARREYRHAGAYAALRWLYDNAPFYKKMNIQIPVIHKNVRRFAREVGFKDEGINRASYLKNGAVHDQWRLGLTREEIKGVLDEQCG